MMSSNANANAYDSDNESIEIKMQKLSLNSRLKKTKKIINKIPKEKSVRSKAYNLFNDILNNDARSDTLEKYIYNMSKDHHQSWENPNFRKMYTSKVRSIKFNLTNPQNPAFLEKVLSREISVKKLPYMSCYEMYPEMYEPIFEKIAKKHLKQNKQIAHEEVENGLFKCPKCKSMKTTFYLLQTRSADEPMTAFINCLECDYHWKD